MLEFQDRFIEVVEDSKRVNLLADVSQDWFLVLGYQNETHTALTVTRRIVPTDIDHYPFTVRVKVFRDSRVLVPYSFCTAQESTTAIFAIGDSDPVTVTGQVKQHSQRGSMTLNLLLPKVQTASGNPYQTGKTALFNMMSCICKMLRKMAVTVFLPPQAQ